MHKKASVILYTRPGCHLCDVAKEQIASAHCDDLFELCEVNIESDQILFERYGLLIPVISINGVDAFRHRVSATTFRDFIMKTCNSMD